ncbi:MAG: putative AlkP superfamily pyrophosphatase or phosphodiesterase [Verrucomicrobiales bacterium]|jgi:predicted AlkP superfamily pyrophosphatase or phosphodiesterase
MTTMCLPEYSGASTISIMPALSWGVSCESIPDHIAAAERVVVLVLDSLGWVQLQERLELAPNLAQMDGAKATTVAPSTTAAALTSISTGVAPGEHGIVGYRFPIGGAVMNALRWTSPAGDHRDIVSPSDAQPVPAFAGGDWHVVGDRQFIGSGFTEAYLGSTPYHGIWHPSSLVAGARELLDAGHTHIYTYYDGLDHTAHIHGFSGAYFNLELQFCDWLVGAMLDALPTGTALVVTADHGQIEAPEIVPVSSHCLSLCTGRSGEPRFRWLHAKPGASAELEAAAIEAHGDIAWVRTRDQIVSEGWFGPTVTPEASSRLGDVALVAHAPIGFDDPGERHADRLVGRHGSVTEAEMLVPILYAIA